MIIRVKKKRSPTLVISTQNWSILAKFAKKTPAKSAVFYWLFLSEVSPPKFPVKSADFSKNLPLKILRKLTFSAKIPRNRMIFLQILTFLPQKSREIGRLFREFWFFFPRKSREIGRFFREFAPENPAKFCFFFREISEALHIHLTVNKSSFVRTWCSSLPF